SWVYCLDKEIAPNVSARDFWKLRHPLRMKQQTNAALCLAILAKGIVELELVVPIHPLLAPLHPHHSIDVLNGVRDLFSRGLAARLELRDCRVESSLRFLLCSPLLHQPQRYRADPHG